MKADLTDKIEILNELITRRERLQKWYYNLCDAVNVGDETRIDKIVVHHSYFGEINLPMCALGYLINGMEQAKLKCENELKKADDELDKIDITGLK